MCLFLDLTRTTNAIQHALICDCLTVHGLPEILSGLSLSSCQARLEWRQSIQKFNNTEKFARLGCICVG